MKAMKKDSTTVATTTPTPTPTPIPTTTLPYKWNHHHHDHRDQVMIIMIVSLLLLLLLLRRTSSLPWLSLRLWTDQFRTRLSVKVSFFLFHLSFCLVAEKKKKRRFGRADLRKSIFLGICLEVIIASIPVLCSLLSLRIIGCVSESMPLCFLGWDYSETVSFFFFFFSEKGLAISSFLFFVFCFCFCFFSFLCLICGTWLFLAE